MYAVLEAIRADMDQKKQTMKEWKIMVLSVTCLFLQLSTFDEKWWCEHNLREDVVTDARSLARTTYQRMVG